MRDFINEFASGKNTFTQTIAHRLINLDVSNDIQELFLVTANHIYFLNHSLWWSVTRLAFFYLGTQIVFCLLFYVSWSVFLFLFPYSKVLTRFQRSHHQCWWSMAQRTRSSISPMAWRFMNAVSAQWSRSGWRELDTMTWSFTDSTWRDSNSLSHMSWSTCRGAGNKRGQGIREERLFFVSFFRRGVKFPGWGTIFFFFEGEAMRVEVVFV